LIKAQRPWIGCAGIGLVFAIHLVAGTVSGSAAPLSWPANTVKTSRMRLDTADERPITNVVQFGRLAGGAAEHAFWMLAGAGIVLGLVLPWVFLLRKQVHRQTRVLKQTIVDHERVEATLAETSTLMETLLENSPDYIYFKDRDSRFLRYSRALVRKLGLDENESLRGKTDFDIFDEAHARPAFLDEQRIIRTGEPIIGKTEKEVLRDGSVTWVLTSKIPLRDGEGRVIGTFGISKDVTAIKAAEAELEEAHKRLLVTSRQAGMAEVATSVLHNVGNVLNSVNVSASLVADTLKHSKLNDIERLAGILRQQQDRLVEFLTSDSRGRQLPEYLSLLAAHLTAEQSMLLQEVEDTRKNIGHIKDIVMMQQGYARVSGVTEKLRASDLLEEALKINEASLARHDIRIVRDCNTATELTVDRHKVLQILVNLIRNAQWACDEGSQDQKCITVGVSNGDGRVHFSVADNGIGIAPENLTRIFQHGFTTRKDGHGFGLHSGALAARDLGGSLAVHSDGLGGGARFTLDLPLAPPAAAPSTKLESSPLARTGAS
jgi:PAS domain S-box-containing protein